MKKKGQIVIKGKTDRHDFISIRGAREHNLKNISLDIPKGKFIVITGLSGSGKSSLAFDTIYVEGQRRYMESLSSYARQFLELQDKPDVDEIKGLSPTIAIDQRTASNNPRSTVGTITEIYDLLRLLYSRVGKPHCHICKEELKPLTQAEIREKISSLIKTSPALILAPLIREARGEHTGVISSAFKAQISKLRIDGRLVEADEFASIRLEREKKHTIEAVIASLNKETPESELNKIIQRALELGDGYITIIQNSKEYLFSTKLYCQKDEVCFPFPEPRLFSFNSPYGACPDCTGLGTKPEFLPELVIPNRKLTLAQGAIQPWTRITSNREFLKKLLSKVAEKHGFSINVPVSELSEEIVQKILYGTGSEIYSIEGKNVTFEGVIPNLETRYRETDSDYIRQELEEYLRESQCQKCAGKRLRPETLSVLFSQRSISDVSAMSVSEAIVWFEKIKGDKNKFTSVEKKIIEPIAREILFRLNNLKEVGLSYLTLDRSAATLSGGEAQRVRLSTQLGTALSGVIYILDEPTIGLHPRDTEQLISALRKLKNFGNTVIVVEHDESVIKAADFVIDIGPGAGEYGGKITGKGTPEDIMRSDTLTGHYLSGKLKITTPEKYRSGTGKNLVIFGAKENNLKNIDVEIPLGKFVCVTGVSGSGKSSLIIDILSRALARHYHRAKTLSGEHKKIEGLEYLDKVVTVDQSPIGRTPRSNPATYTGVFTTIRDFFAELPEAKMKGYDAGKFSFNVKGGGRCEACAGEGFVQIEMHFLPDVYVECKECRGKRYNPEALEIHYKDKNIVDILEMTVTEARKFFEDKSAISDKLGILEEVGLGYMKLGQSATTLSGGEAQRVKLATELSRRETGRTLYILDEPTTGLHFDDIKRLLGVLQILVDKGNTVLIIEHNLDVIKSSDWVIDMGPGAGSDGGEIVSEGTPESVAKAAKSYTGQYLKKILYR